MAPAMGTVKAMSVPQTKRWVSSCGSARDANHWLPNIYTIPSTAAATASHVRLGKRCLSTMRPSTAVSKGPTASSTNTWATLVMSKASIKAVNMTDQHTPEIQKDLDCQVTPHHCSTAPCPLHRLELPSSQRTKGSKSTSDTPAKKLRQKVTSNPSALSSWRVTTPAVPHKNGASTMPHKAWLCVKRTACISLPWRRAYARALSRSVYANECFWV